MFITLKLYLVDLLIVSRRFPFVNGYSYMEKRCPGNLNVWLPCTECAFINRYESRMLEGTGGKLTVC